MPVIHKQEKSQEFLEERSLDTTRDDTTQNPSRRVTGIPREKVTGFDLAVFSFQNPSRKVPGIPRGKVTGHDTTRHRILREKVTGFKNCRKSHLLHLIFPRGKVTGQATTRHDTESFEKSPRNSSRKGHRTRDDTTQNPCRKSDRIQKLSEIAFATSHISCRKSDRI